MTDTKVDIAQLKEMLVPYQEKYKLSFNEDDDMLIVNNSFHFFLNNIYHVKEDEVSITITAKGYSIHLWKRIDMILCTIF
jgi:hypothetical protein